LEQEIGAKTAQTLRCPRGAKPVRIDPAGRLKLPETWVKYLFRLPDQILFITKVGELGRMYAFGAWEREIEKLKAEPAVQKRLAFVAEAFGAEIEVDLQGRITLPQKLRESLGLAGKDVQLLFSGDIITIYPEETFETLLAGKLASLDSDLAKAAELGFDLG
jgi:DNA-binding transcriptional regulator/RsmH inhibitor MraZ